MRRVFVGLAQVFVGLAAQLRNNRLLEKFRQLGALWGWLSLHDDGKTV